jgi:hypothetical protein
MDERARKAEQCSKRSESTIGCSLLDGPESLQLPLDLHQIGNDGDVANQRGLRGACGETKRHDAFTAGYDLCLERNQLCTFRARPKCKELAR